MQGGVAFSVKLFSEKPGKAIQEKRWEKTKTLKLSEKKPLGSQPLTCDCSHVVKRVEQHDTELRIELDAWKRRWLPCPTGFWVYSFRGDRLFPEIRP